MRSFCKIGLSEIAASMESRGLSQLYKFAQSLASQVDQAAGKTDTNPTDAQAEAGNYTKGKVRLHGLEISIENPKGSVRSGVDADGNSWSNTMSAHYGYIRRTEGKDGDHVDVFIGPEPELELVFVINQVDPKSKRFDEHKCVFGVGTEQQARDLYMGSYAADWQGLGSVTAMTMPQFKWWLVNGDTTKRIDDGLFAKKSEDDEISDNSGIVVKMSATHGFGCYAVRDFEPGDVVGDAVLTLPEKEAFGRDQLLLTKLGRYANYQPVPNIGLRASGDSWKAVALQSIKTGEELFFSYNYVNEHARLGLPFAGVLVNGTNPDGLPDKVASDTPTMTVAVDLDGTLAEMYDVYDEDSIPDPRPNAQKWMKKFRDAGYRLIVHTVRGNTKLIKEWLEKHKIEYDYINENPDQPEGSSDKLLADVYVDDRGVAAAGSWDSVGPAVMARAENE